MMKEIKRYMDGYSYIKFHDKSKVQNQQVSQTQRRFLKIMSIGIQPIVLNIQYDT